jgi:hypothetical protein
VWARVGDHEVEACVGSYVWKPRGVLHSFWNAGPDPARVLEIISPAGFERLFREVGELMRGASSASEADIYKLCEQYGLSFDRSWLAEVESRFGSMRIV